MAATPTVSVIIATHDRPACLLQAIRSVLAQSFTDYELVVAEDGASDGTAEVVESIGAGALRHVRLPHTGRPSVTRNVGLAAAGGTYIAFLDDEDVWRADKLERQVALLEATERVGFVYSDLRFLHTDGTASESVIAPDQIREGLIFDDLLDECAIATSTVLARRSLLDRVGGFNEALETFEAYDLWLRLAWVARAAFIPAPLVLRRRHPAALEERRAIASLEDAIRSLLAADARFPLTTRQRARLRRSIAKYRTRLGAALIARGSLAEGRRELLRALRAEPLEREAWLAHAGSWRGASAHGA
jgi:glycosyltransferase involved in cell wall biosynthesis